LIAGGLILVLLRAPFMVPIVLVPAFMLAIGTFVVRKITARLYSGEVTTSTELWTRLHELVGGAKAIRLFGREAHQQALFVESADALRRTQERSSLVNMNYGTALALTSAACTYLLYYFGGLRVIAPEAQMRVGDLVGLVPIAMFLFGPLNAVSGMLGQIYKSKTAADRLCELLDAPAEFAGDVPAFVPPRGALVLRDLRFGYTPEREVLRGLSLRVEPGELLALVGPSGAGKTTTMNLICRLYEPWGGTMTWAGIDAPGVDPRAWRRAIGVVMQETYLFKESLAENIRCGRPWVSDAQVALAARLAGVERFIDDLPEGYETALGDGGSELSGGQRQRVGIARALAADPPLLILDEPTAALDADAEAAFLDALEGVVRRRMGIVIAHRPTTIARADRSARLEMGIVVDGVVA
jgi:ABC-type multidrug transport system fused ATPase/permease subunit